MCVSYYMDKVGDIMAKCYILSSIDETISGLMTILEGKE